MPRRPTPPRLTIILPPDRPPKGRPRVVDLLVRKLAEPGDAIRVRVIDRRSRKPVAGVPIEMQSMRGQPLATTSTDGTGEALFVAPRVEHPADLLFQLPDPRFTNYLFPSDRRARALELTFGCHQLAFTTVLPPLQLATLPARAAVRFEIAQGVGWWDGESFPALIEKAKRKGWIADDSWWTTKGGMEEQFQHKGPADMWTFFGHSYRDPETDRTGGIRAWRPFGAIIKGTMVTVKDLCAAAKRGQGPPGIVVLGGCATADLLQELVDCCVKLAVGVTAKISPPLMQRALCLFWEALLDGKTLREALADANTYLGGNAWNSTGAQLTYRCKPHLAGVEEKTLDEIRAASREP
ncbi:MAG: hypothetical protein U0575_03360 [Phycisphaerales bacterium]|jgi:hypothetical protein